MHKFCAWRNDVFVESEASVLFILIKDDLVFPVVFDFCLALLLLLDVLGRAEASRPLLVHFCSWSHSINREVQHLLGAHDIDDFVCVHEDVVVDFLLTLGLGSVGWAGAGVNDAVHV